MLSHGRMVLYSRVGLGLFVRKCGKTGEGEEEIVCACVFVCECVHVCVLA